MQNAAVAGVVEDHPVCHEGLATIYTGPGGSGNPGGCAKVHEHANFTPSITAREQARVNGDEHFEGRSTVDTNDGTWHFFA